MAPVDLMYGGIKHIFEIDSDEIVQQVELALQLMLMIIFGALAQLLPCLKINVMC